MGNKFGLPKRKKLWKDYLNKWIVIFPSNSPNKSFSGKLIKIIDNDYGVLNPFSGVKYTKNEPVYTLKKGDSLIYLPGSNIEPTTKESLENRCEYNLKSIHADSKS